LELSKIMKFSLKFRSAFSNDGFSLIEVIVATAVSSVILLMVYSAHRTIITAADELTHVAEYYERINLALWRLDREISCAYINKTNKQICFISENNRGAPFLGKINFVTVDYQDLYPGTNIKKEFPFSDIKEVGYSVKPDPDNPEKIYLMRREDRSYNEDPENGGKESIILDNIIDIKFEFKVRNDWVDSWDSKKLNKFPEAVKTTLRVKNYKGVEEEYVLISYSNMAN
jgi:type II secretion system protein J